MTSLAWSVSAVGPVIVFSGAAAVYLLLSLVAGARLAVSRLAAERLEDESGLPEGLDFDSRAWSAMEFVRHMALVASGAAAVFGPWHQPGFLPATGVGVLLILLGRVLVALIVPRAPEGLLRMAVPALALLDRTVGALLMPLARTHESLAARHRRHRASEDEDAREEQFEEVIRDAEEEGLIEAEQTELMREIADVGDAVAREVMTPRTEIDAVGADAPLEELVRTFVESRHSRLPVYEGSLDRIVGVVSVRDLMGFVPASAGGGENAPRARELMRPVKLVPGAKRVLELLREFQRQRQQIAIVVDEYGGTAGLVTIEDLLEEIVGEIRDEYEPPGTAIQSDGQGGFIAEGLVAIDELKELVGVDVPEEGVETLGGLILSRLGRIPREGESVEVEGLTLEVLKMDGRRIAAVRILSRAAIPAPDEDGDDA
ncbi:MAG: hemolysin family protein [Acidobacteriota bacterium]|nr:hemolysin family protein [Acidobacteriota bacterium]